MDNYCEVATETQQNMGIIKRIFNIFFEPEKVFKSVIEKPRVFLPVVLIILGLFAISVPRLPFTENYSRQALEKIYKSEKFLKTQQITPEQADKSIDQNMKFQKIFSYFAPLGTIFILFLQTLIFLMVFKLLGGVGTFKQTFAVFSYSFFINLLGEAVKTVNVLISGKADAANSIGLLMQDDKTSFLFNFLNGIDVFGLWAFIVAAIGLSVVHGVSRKKAYIWVFSLCLFFMLASSAYVTIQAAAMYNQFGITI